MKRKKLKKKVPVELTGLDQIDFKKVYRIKSKSGLYEPVTGGNSDNIHVCVNILDKDDRCSTKGINIERLSDFEFATYAGSDNLNIKEVFQNMLDYISKNKAYVFPANSSNEVMDIMCPNFDEDLFKDYHSRKVIMWFDSILKKLTQLKDAKNAK